MSIPEVYTRRQLNALYRSIPLKDTTFRLLRKYFSAASNLYGVIPLRKIYEIIDSQNPGLITKDTFISFARVAAHETEGYFILGDHELFSSGISTPFLDYEIIDTTLLEIDIVRYLYLKKAQFNKPYYIPEKSLFLKYADPFHSDAVDEVGALRTFLKESLHMQNDLENVVYGVIFFGSRCLNVGFNTILRKLEEQGVTIDNEDQKKQFSNLYQSFYNQTRMQIHRGNTPIEISNLKTKSQSYLPENKQKNVPFFPPFNYSPVNTAPFAVPQTTEEFDPDQNYPGSFNSDHSNQQRKAGRNDPCPCGSGKKYKRCCGR